MMKYQMLKSWPASIRKGWVSDSPSGIDSSTVDMCSHRKSHSRKMIVMTKTMLANAPWMKSVTMTAICPPRKVKIRDVARSPTMSAPNVETSTPAMPKVVGRPQ
ncbi:MAG: hypothetical protein ACYTGD_15920 [Planctomycetota bacterium]